METKGVMAGICKVHCLLQLETCVPLHKLTKFNNFPSTKRLKRMCCCQLVTDLFLLHELTAVQEKTAER